MEIKNATVALAALGQTTRLSVFRLLVEAGPGGRMVGEIAEALELPGATLSFHLKELTAAGLIEGESRGRYICYRANFAAMNDLIRPALYQGYHEIIPVREHPSGSCVTADVVGPICESGDFLAQNRDMPDVRQGELLAVLSAGAYGFSMSSNYNSRPMAEEVLVDGDQWNVIRSRQSWEDLIRGESIPE